MRRKRVDVPNPLLRRCTRCAARVRDAPARLATTNRFQDTEAGMIKTVIGSFDSYDEAQRVVRDLEDDGFMANDVSIVASNVDGRYQTTDANRTDADRIAADADGVRTERADHDRSGAATGAVTGGVVGGAAGLAASLLGLAIPGVGPIIAAGPIVA
ncbi:MAG: general stress protein, partial [Casimicrobiaceae bacterium]